MNQRQRALLLFIFFSAVTVALIGGFDRSYVSLPAIGRILHPFVGLWKPPQDQIEVREQTLTLPGLSAPVRILVDADRVKHIFAANDADLYVAQGYVVASDRLWQMDFITRVAGARLSEVMGERTLEMDRLFLRLGLPMAAEIARDEMLKDPATQLALESFSAGVNAYVAQLRDEDLPFEFKLLDYRPEAWSPLKSALLLKFMAYNLSGFSYDLPLTRSFLKLSAEDFLDLFPLEQPGTDPIVPSGKSWDFAALAPEPPSEVFRSQAASAVEPLPTPHPRNGSNNWAVRGMKSTTGLPILSNDIHLSYGLPSLWYEIQLVSNTQNVYGVTIPGAPGVILGFNRDLAWAVTNGGSDVMDWYEIRYREDGSRHEYKYDGEWRPVISKDHTIQVRGKPPVTVSLRQTIHGPIVYNDDEQPLLGTIGRGLALRWAAHDPSNELRTFLELNRSRTLKECEQATRHFVTPNQNFLCASNRDEVGIWHQGAYPLRWPGQGRLIADGSDSRYAWKGWVPREEIPSFTNPARGFLSSANQPPSDASYPHYLGWPFELPFRGARINEMLKNQKKFAPDDFRRMQSDTLNSPARSLVPVFLKSVDVARLSESQKGLLERMKAWNFLDQADQVAPTLYAEWYKQLERALWSDELGDPKQVQYPRMSRTVELLVKTPDAKWVDRIDTPERETLGDLLVMSLAAAEDQLKTQLGKDPARWTWGRYQPTEFPHLGKIPGLGTAPMELGGSSESVFANHGNHGPVWRAVTALGRREPQAWGIYPGGQSGHPGSRYYDNFVSAWSQGELRPLLYLSRPDEGGDRIVATIEARSEVKP